VVEIEAYCEKLSRFFFDACNGPIAEEQCSLICHDKENSLGGSCINQKCICYAWWTSPSLCSAMANIMLYTRKREKKNHKKRKVVDTCKQGVGIYFSNSSLWFRKNKFFPFIIHGHCYFWLYSNLWLIKKNQIYVLFLFIPIYVLF
jgi:hypothetical protein